MTNANNQSFIVIITQCGSYKAVETSHRVPQHPKLELRNCEAGSTERNRGLGSHRCARMGLWQGRQLCLRLCVGRRALRRAGGGSAGLVSLQWWKVITGARSSSTRGWGRTERGLRRRRTVHLRAQRAECIQREVLWLLGKQIERMVNVSQQQNFIRTVSEPESESSLLLHTLTYKEFTLVPEQLR